MSPIQWAGDSPGPRRTPSVEFFNNNQTTAFVRPLGDAVAVLTHWVPHPLEPKRGRSLPCLGGKCPHCGRGLPAKKVGYAPALLYGGSQPDDGKRRKPVLWFIPAAMIDGMPTGIRGAVFKVKGAQPGRDPVFTETKRTTEANTPEAFDVKAVLSRKWR
jgi:hypothetical protein